MPRSWRPIAANRSPTRPVAGGRRRRWTRVRNTPAPESELFALVTVTDRTTGERRILTRGTPKPEYAGWVADPDTAPANRIYWESEEAIADAQVEVVVRSVHSATDATAARDSTRTRSEPSSSATGAAASSTASTATCASASSPVTSTSRATTPVPVVIRVRGVPRLRLPKVHETAVDGLLYVGLSLQPAREAAIIERKQAMAALQARLVTPPSGRSAGRCGTRRGPAAA